VQHPTNESPTPVGTALHVTDKNTATRYRFAPQIGCPIECSWTEQGPTESEHGSNVHHVLGSVAVRAQDWVQLEQGNGPQILC